MKKSFISVMIVTVFSFEPAKALESHSAELGLLVPGVDKGAPNQKLVRDKGECEFDRNQFPPKIQQPIQPPKRRQSRQDKAKREFDRN